MTSTDEISALAPEALMYNKIIEFGEHFDWVSCSMAENKKIKMRKTFVKALED